MFIPGGSSSLTATVPFILVKPCIPPAGAIQASWPVPGKEVATGIAWLLPGVWTSPGGIVIWTTCHLFGSEGS